MKRTLKLTFFDETEWATVLEAFRRLPNPSPIADKAHPDSTAARKVAALCREYLDSPPKPQSGEGK